MKIGIGIGLIVIGLQLLGTTFDIKERSKFLVVGAICFVLVTTGCGLVVWGLV